jgi:hypothetical protein
MSLVSTERSSGHERDAPPRADTRSRTEQQRRSFAVSIGCLLVSLGLLLSGTVLEWTILPAGTVVGTARRTAALVLCRILLVIAGAYLVVRRPRVTVVHLAALVPGLVLSGVVGAVLVQIAYVPPPIFSGWKSFAPVVERNQLGFRGRPITYAPEDYVIVLLGDSQVEAMKLAFDAMPERRLEFYLNSLGKRTRVFSIGAGGYGQDQELLALEEYFQKYRADLVVLWQTPGNDIWNNLFKTHMFNRNPKPTFWLNEQESLRGPSESLLQPLGNSPIVAVALWKRAFGIPWRDKTWERHLPEPYRPLSHYDGPVRTDWQQRWNTNLGRMRDEDLDTEKSHLAVLLTPRSKRMQYALDLTRALTKRIQELADSNHAKLSIFQVDDLSFSSDDEQVYVLSKKFYRVSGRQFKDNWSYVNSSFDTSIIPITVKDWRVGPEDGHLNTLATDKAMADLAQRLRSRIVEKRAVVDLQ